MTDQPVNRLLQVNDVRLSYFEWGAPAERTLLLLHATGFHARCWDQVIAALPPEWRNGHIIALETRGHGRSEKHGPYNWQVAGADLIAFVDALGLAHITAAGHSMGGHLLVLAAAARPDRFEQLTLIDPVITAPLPPEAQPASRDPTEHPVSRRRNVWHDWRSMFEHFESRHPYSLWQEAVLADYCRYGLLPDRDGGDLVLACPPLVEAAYYGSGLSSNVHAVVGEVRQPTQVVRAQSAPQTRAPFDFTYSPTWPDLAAALPRGRDLQLTHLTHFIPMQDPVLTARLIADPD